MTGTVPPPCAFEQVSPRLEWDDTTGAVTATASHPRKLRGRPPRRDHEKQQSRVHPFRGVQPRLVERLRQPDLRRWGPELPRLRRRPDPPGHRAPAGRPGPDDGRLGRPEAPRSRSLLVFAGAFATWWWIGDVATTADLGQVYMLAMLGAGGAFLLSLVNSFKRVISPALVMAFAARRGCRARRDQRRLRGAVPRHRDERRPRHVRGLRRHAHRLQGARHQGGRQVPHGRRRQPCSAWWASACCRWC